MLFSTKIPIISSLFSKYTYKVALLYPAALAISSIEVAAVTLSINNTDADNGTEKKRAEKRTPGKNCFFGKTAEVIADSIVDEQKIDVDAISGATNSSTVIKKAVENALKSSKLTTF